MLFELTNNDNEKSLETVKVTSLSNIGWNEKQLEDLLADNITNLIREEFLMVISQERRMQEEPDILALDKDGTLFIFELKREKSEPQHLLQVMRYGQKFGIFDYEQLNDKYQKYEKSIGVNLKKAHRGYFDLDKPIKKNQFNQEQRFIVVTNGVDVKTLRSIYYWKEKGLPIEPLIYNVYKINNVNILDFNPYGGGVDEYELAETSNHIVNTNISYSDDSYLDMITNDKASAYGSKKHAVDSIQKNDRVFLYHTKVGICAVGRATSDDAKETDDGHERYVRCAFNKKINPVKEPNRALSASEINEALESSRSFRQTRFSIPDDEADMIEKMFRNKK